MSSAVQQPAAKSWSASYQAVAAAVLAARSGVVEFAAGASGELLDDIGLAASEALTNVVVHAYPEGAGAIRHRGC